MSSRRKPDDTPADTPAEEQPVEGGSYVRDPATGALSRVEFTQHDEPAPDAGAPADTSDASQE